MNQSTAMLGAPDGVSIYFSIAFFLISAGIFSIA
jgi:hypothetical protein